ncbi:hypothetical protein EXW96_11700 [Paenibacillus sp. JMULE4]|uniref:MotE family protein n=1 Tax=Paenibacillus TaxID=44249 RepID=UPI0008883EE3|nr:MULTISPECIES: hypothetical protein [Paenibacillus]NTZ18210.1 hypothetical protein [Paenibacillus sp. JMULE4]GCL71363.1 hypothetical protein PN4B1_12680 [Paenibacillus naphthalenovorans]SDI87090.1 Flagellar motility protein MotE, a chaperone for MotC folding [Paenibacillus naphthalenovorans]
MANANTEQSSSYGAMERFLIWFLIPFVFTAVLLGVLMTIFGYDVMSNAVRTVSKIPVINSILPITNAEDGNQDPQQTQGEAVPGQEPTAANYAEQLEQKEQELKQAEAALQQRDQTIKDLQLKNSGLEEQIKTKTISEDEYTAQIQQLAGMYAKMSPSKAAPILENLTKNELVLVLGMMKPDERVKVLERMDPAKAAEASILLKDQTSVRDTQIAALQERLNQSVSATSQADTHLSKDDLGSTFANMTPKSAATVLIEMQKSNPDKVLSILKSMDSMGRSRVLSAVSEQSKETAALLSARLVQ